MRLISYLTRLAAVFCAAVAAQGAPVTFQIDLANLIDEGGFVPGTDRVEVRGEFNGWAAGSELMRTAPDSTVYAGTFEVAGAAGSWVKFKFWRTPDSWESTADRPIQLTGSAMTLPVVTFNKVNAGDPYMVTFKVNMATQIASGNFNPATDLVQARGEFNGWGGGFVLLPDPENTDVYVGTTPVNFGAGNPVAYKFHMQREGRPEVWEDNQPGSTDRIYVLTTEAEQTVPTVFFNNVTGTPIKAALAVTVDMNAQILSGAFVKETDEVWLRGNKVGWGNPPEGLQLFEDASRAGVYTNTALMDTTITGENVAFKFTIFKPETAGTTWEEGADKIVTFSGTEPLVNTYRTKSYGPVFFNGVTISDLLAEDTLVTFRVDMTNARRTGGGAAFDPVSEGVWLNGAFVNWTWNSMNSELQMNDAGEAGDETAGDHIYTLQRLFPKGSPARLVYKYGIQDGDNEAGVGQDHVRYIRGVGTYVMPLDVFGTIQQEPGFGDLTIAKTGANQVTVSWLGRPGVKLQRVDLNTGAALGDVANTDGQSSATLTASGQAEFYRLVQP